MSPDDTGGTTLVLRLTKKLAEEIDGISLVGYRVGDLVHLSRKDADVLLAEGWAEVVAEQMYIVGPGADRRAYRSSPERHSAADRRRRKTDRQEPTRIKT